LQIEPIPAVSLEVDVDILFLLFLVVLIGGGGAYVAGRPTVTPQEQNRIIRERSKPDEDAEGE